MIPRTICTLIIVLGSTNGIRFTAMKCSGQDFNNDEILCPDPKSVIKINEAVFNEFVYNNIHRAGCSYDPNDCGKSVAELNATYYNVMKTKCEGRRSCNDLHVPSTYVGCGTQQYSDYVLLTYECQGDTESVEVFQCAGSSFDQTRGPKCHTSRGIKIINAHYRVTYGACKPSGTLQDACRFPVELTYFYEITGGCDGQSYCNNVLARRSTREVYCPERKKSATDTVSIIYVCLGDRGLTTTSGSTTYSEVTSSTRYPESSSHEVTTIPREKEALFIGIYIGVGVTLLVILITVIIICYKRKKQSHGDTSIKQAAPSRQDDIVSPTQRPLPSIINSDHETTEPNSGMYEELSSSHTNSLIYRN